MGARRRRPAFLDDALMSYSLRTEGGIEASLVMRWSLPLLTLFVAAGADGRPIDV